MNQNLKESSYRTNVKAPLWVGSVLWFWSFSYGGKNIKKEKQTNKKKAMTLLHFTVYTLVFGTVTQKILSVICTGPDRIFNALLGSMWCFRKLHQSIISIWVDKDWLCFKREWLLFIDFFQNSQLPVKMSSFTSKISWVSIKIRLLPSCFLIVRSAQVQQPLSAAVPSITLRGIKANGWESPVSSSGWQITAKLLLSLHLSSAEAHLRHL